MLFVAVLLACLAAFVVFVVLEGKRSEKAARRPGHVTSLLREGLLELQGHLEPDRKVEVVREQERKEDLLIQLDENGEPPKPKS